MTVVLDANIYISAFFWGGNPRAVLERVIKKQDELLVTEEILDEIKNVLTRPKFHTGINEIDFFIKSIEEIGNKIDAKSKIKNGSRDKTDNKYIECAIAGKADYIISGDSHLLEMKKYRNIKIVSAREYLNAVVT